MTDNDINKKTKPATTPEAGDGKKKRRKRPLWLRLIKWVSITCITLVLLVVGLISLVVWTLTPERLTPLVNKYASEYLLADVNAGRIELTFWSTFPRFSVTVDSLDMRSRVFDSLPDSVRRTLPVGADSLLYVKHFSGGIDLLSLAKGNIGLYEVDFTDIRANLVTVDSTTANYLIVPPSEPKPEEEPSPMPDIAIDRFTIADGMAVRYRALADSLDCSLNLDRAALTDDKKPEKPTYTLALGGDIAAAMPWIDVPKTPFAIDGRLEWESKRPLAMGLDEFRFEVGKVALEFSTVADFTDTPTVSKLTAKMPKVAVKEIITLIPERFHGELARLDTDMAVELAATLKRPYTIGGKLLPVIDAALKIDTKRLNYDRLSLTNLDADIKAFIDCNNFDASVIDVEQLKATGKAIDFKLEAEVTRPVTDPYIKARFDGGITFQNLPNILLDKLPFTLRGSLRGLANITTRVGYLTPKLFYKAKIDGTLTLENFRMAMIDGSFETFVNNAELNLGSSSRVAYEEQVVDSMLTASLTIDTMALTAPGIELCGAQLKAGVGARNIATSADTSQINPIGAAITAHRITLRSDSDSLRIRLRDTGIRASLQRYASEARSPHLQASVTSKSARMADRYNRFSVRECEMTFDMHPKARPVMSARSQARFDSIAALHPELSTDSIRSMMRAERRKRMAERDEMRRGREDIKIELDNSIVTLLRRWNTSGTLKAKRARLFTPYFPSRNRLTGLDLAFSTDSVVIRDTRLKMNHSDFVFNGSVRNIARALTSRHGSPFVLDFNVKSDTIDVNDLTATMLRGAVFADRISAGTMKQIADNDNDEQMQRDLDDQLPDTMRAAVLVPSNITGRFSLKARHVLYADLWLHGLDGIIEMFDGAVNLDRLRAYTSIGAVNFSALYSAPTIEDLSVAAAVRIRRLNLRSVLDMMPEIDSLLPLLGEVRGIVDADLALTTDLDSMMNLDIASLNLALKISGDSLQLLDNETFRTIAKWMLFKKKQRNMIDHMDVELAIHDGYIDLYPFIFDMDRYRLGVRGSNDASLNLDYHVAVIKSPIPFKFGINIKGTPEKMKIRLGKARINEKTVAESRQITDTVRVNLMNEITRVFRRGVRATGSRGLKLQDTRRPGSGSASAKPDDDKFSHADSVALIQQGLIERPAGFVMPGDSIATSPADDDGKSKKKKRK